MDLYLFKAICAKANAAASRLEFEHGILDNTDCSIFRNCALKFGRNHTECANNLIL